MYNKLEYLNQWAQLFCVRYFGGGTLTWYFLRWCSSLIDVVLSSHRHYPPIVCQEAHDFPPVGFIQPTGVADLYWYTLTTL